MKKNFINSEQLINHPLFELAKTELIREGKISFKKEKNKIIYNIKNVDLLVVDILEKMLQLISTATKQNQKKLLDNYIKEKLYDKKI